MGRRQRARLGVQHGMTINGNMDIVNVRSSNLIQQIPGQARIRGVDDSPDLDRIFVGNGTGGICNVFDGTDYRLLKHVPLGEDADNVRYNPHTRRIYIVHADHELAVVNSDNYAMSVPIELPKSLGAFKVERSRPRMYANAKAAGLVVAVDAEKGQVVDRFPVAPAAVNASLAIDEVNRRLFVGCRSQPAVVVMDSDSRKILASVPIPGGIDDLWFDVKRGRLYASCGEGAIAVIRRVNADYYKPLANIPTARGARTSLFDAEGGRLYIAVPRHAERPAQTDPEIWVYTAQP